MLENLKKYCREIIPLTDAELGLLDHFFEVREYKKRDFILESGSICNFIAFIDSGTVRHFHVKDGDEKTCDISFTNSWITDFKSFTNDSPCIMNLQAMAATQVFLIKKSNLEKLYSECKQFETFGRLMAEQGAMRATEIAMSLSSEKPEERFLNLLKKQPNLFQQVPQKYIANFLGIGPESLSRIKNRIITKEKS